MSKENIICGTFRLNMDNPQHVRINEVLKNLNPNIYKSKNQFLVEAATFYIEHYGDEGFMEPKADIQPEYLKREDLEEIKSRITDDIVYEARQEIMRMIGGMISGMQFASPISMVPLVRQGESHNAPQEEVHEEPVEDEVVAGCALSWMMNGEGDDE